MDIACAIGFDELSKDELRCAYSIACDMFGSSALNLLNLYKVFYGFYFSHVHNDDPKAYEWCVRCLNGYE